MLLVKRNVVLQEFYCYLRCWGGDFTAVYISCGLFISFRTGRKLFFIFPAINPLVDICRIPHDVI